LKEDSSFTNFSFITVGRITAISLQAVFFLVFASLLEPEVYGELNVVIALAGTFAAISRLGLDKTLQVYRAKNSPLTKEVDTLFTILTAASALILVFLDPLASLLSIGISFFAMHLHNLQGLRKYRSFMFSNLLKSGTFIIIPLSLYFVYEIPGVLIGMAISHFIASLPYFYNLRITKPVNLKKNYKIILHNFGVTSGTNLPYLVDKLLIGQLFGTYFVGIYQFNLQIFMALGVLPGVLWSFLLTEESKGNPHPKLIKLVILASVVISLIAIYLAPIGVRYIFPNYVEGIFSLQIMVTAIIPMTFQSVLYAKLMSKESTKVGFSSIVSIGSLLLLLSTLGKELGLVGLSFAVLISIILNVIFLYYLLKKQTSNPSIT